MTFQQLITFGIVFAAALYLARYLLRSARDLFSARGGCSGCEKCAFAKEATASRPSSRRDRPDTIPLSEVRVLPERRERAGHP